MVHIRGESPQSWLRDANLWNDLGFSLYAALSVYHMVIIFRRKKEV